MYESPIKLIINQYQDHMLKEQERYILNYVQNYFVDIDREELFKALSYDRNQYEKGYRDGIKAFTEKILTEIDSALRNNYNVRSERMEKLLYFESDPFLQYVNGKIDCLRGLQDFIEKEMVGDSE